MQFTLQQENSHLRNQNTALRRENEALRTEVGLDIYQQKCKKEAEEENRKLSAVIRGKNAEISRQQKTIDRLGKDLDKAQIRAEEFRLKAEQAVSEKKDLSKKLTGLSLSLQSKDKKIERLETENLEMKGQISSLNTQISDLTSKVETLSDANAKMGMLLNTNNGNSGVTTAKVRLGGKKVIVNSRKPSGKSPGAQKGHEGHKRKQDIKACGGSVRIVGTNDPLWSNKDYVFECYSVKQVISPAMIIFSDIYLVPSFRNIHTGAHKQADCPHDLHNEVNYSPEYKATLMAATQGANLSVQKALDFVELMTHNPGSIPSTGFVSDLPLEFAIKSGAEQSAVYEKLLHVHSLHVDGTVVKIGRRQYNLVIVTSSPYSMYFFRPMKGHDSVKGTPIEQTVGILVHDHDVTYYSYGAGHQECLEHILRYLTRSIEEERDLSWAIEAKKLIQGMIHAAKEADKKWREDHPDEVPHSESDDFSEDEDMKVQPRFSEEMIAEFKKELLEVTEKGLEEYERHPAKKWFKDGYNACKRLHDDPDSYLLFLKDDRVDATNADAEVKARSVKRKLAVCNNFRGFLGVVAYSQAKGVIDTFMSETKTTLGKMADVFRRDLTLQDTLRIKKTLVPIYASALQSDENILVKNGEAMKNARAKYDEEVIRLNAAQKEYDDAVNHRIELSGKDSDPSEEEKILKDKLAVRQHEEYCAQCEINTLEKKIAYDERHKDDLQRQSDRNDEEIAVLEQRTAEQAKKASEKKEGAQENGISGEDVLSEEETPEVKAARQKFEACQDKLNQAAALREEKMTQYFNAEYAPKSLIDDAMPNGESNEAYKERVEKELAESGKVLSEAIEELQEAQKELDSARKGYKKRAYRKRGKGRHAARKAADDEQAV